MKEEVEGKIKEMEAIHAMVRGSKEGGAMDRLRKFIRDFFSGLTSIGSESFRINLGECDRTDLYLHYENSIWLLQIGSRGTQPLTGKKAMTIPPHFVAYVYNKLPSVREELKRRNIVEPELFIKADEIVRRDFPN